MPLSHKKMRLLLKTTCLYLKGFIQAVIIMKVLDENLFLENHLQRYFTDQNGPKGGPHENEQYDYFQMSIFKLRNKCYKHLE